MNQLQETFNNQGTLIFEQNDIPLDDKEWQQLESILSVVEYEHVVGGDAGEGEGGGGWKAEGARVAAARGRAGRAAGP